MNYSVAKIRHRDYIFSSSNFRASLTFPAFCGKHFPSLDFDNSIFNWTLIVTVPEFAAANFVKTRMKTRKTTWRTTISFDIARYTLALIFSPPSDEPREHREKNGQYFLNKQTLMPYGFSVKIPTITRPRPTFGGTTLPAANPFSPQSRTGSREKLPPGWCNPSPGVFRF